MSYESRLMQCVWRNKTDDHLPAVVSLVGLSVVAEKNRNSIRRFFPLAKRSEDAVELLLTGKTISRLRSYFVRSTCLNGGPIRATRGIYYTANLVQLADN